MIDAFQLSMHASNILLWFHCIIVYHIVAYKSEILGYYINH